MTTLDVDALADEVLPLDHGYDRERVATAAALVGELVRRLNRATFGSAIPYAPHVDRLVSHVAVAAGGIPQLLGQLGAALGRIAEQDPTLYDDRRDSTPASETAALAVHELGRATHAAHDLTMYLEAARSNTSHLGHDQ